MGRHSPCPGGASVSRGYRDYLGEPCPRSGALTPFSPQHCLLGWDILPPKSEKSSGPQSLDLWSCVTSEAQHQPLSTGPSHLVWFGAPWEGQGPGVGLGPAESWGQDWGVSLQGPIPISWP